MFRPGRPWNVQVSETVVPPFPLVLALQTSPPKRTISLCRASYAIAVDSRGLGIGPENAPLPPAASLGSMATAGASAAPAWPRARSDQLTRRRPGSPEHSAPAATRLCGATGDVRVALATWHHGGSSRGSRDARGSRHEQAPPPLQPNLTTFAPSSGRAGGRKAEPPLCLFLLRYIHGWWPGAVLHPWNV